MSGNTVTGNSAAEAAGIGNEDTMTSTGDTITGNSALLTGGGVGNSGTMTLADTTISGNTSGGTGNGIFNMSGNLTISSTAGSNISDNVDNQSSNDLVLAGTGNTIISGNVNLGPSANLTDIGSGNNSISGIIHGQATSGTVQGLTGAYFQIGNSSNQQVYIQPAAPTNSSWLGVQTPAATVPLNTASGGSGSIDFQNISGNGFTDNNNHTYFNFGNNNNSVEARWSGDITIPGTGTTPVPISFQTASDDGSMLYIDGVAVVSNNNYQGVTNAQGTLDLSPGLHTIDIEYYNGGGGAAMTARWDPTGSNGVNSPFVDIPPSVLSSPSNGVIKAGTGSLTLSNVNTYVGLTEINYGTLEITQNAALGASTAGLLVSAGGDLALASGVHFTATEPINLSGNGPNGDGAVQGLSGSTSFGAPFTITNSAGVGTVAGTFTLTSNVSLPAGISLTLDGTGSAIANGTITSDGGGLRRRHRRRNCHDYQQHLLLGQRPQSGQHRLPHDHRKYRPGTDGQPHRFGVWIRYDHRHHQRRSDLGNHAGARRHLFSNRQRRGPASVHPASPPANASWIGNQTPAVTAQLTGNIDFPDISDNGFEDNNFNTYVNFGNNNNSVEARWYGDIVIPGTGTTPIPSASRPEATMAA